MDIDRNVFDLAMRVLDAAIEEVDGQKRTELLRQASALFREYIDKKLESRVPEAQRRPAR